MTNLVEVINALDVSDDEIAKALDNDKNDYFYLRSLIWRWNRIRQAMVYRDGSDADEDWYVEHKADEWELDKWIYFADQMNKQKDYAVGDLWDMLYENAAQAVTA